MTRAATPASSVGSMATSRTPERLDGPRPPFREACTCTYRPAPVQMGSVKAWTVPCSSTTSRGAVNHGPHDLPSPLVRRRIVTAPAGGTSHSRAAIEKVMPASSVMGAPAPRPCWPGDGQRVIGRPQRLESRPEGCAARWPPHHSREVSPRRRRAAPRGPPRAPRGARETRVPRRERCRHVAVDLHWLGATCRRAGEAGRAGQGTCTFNGVGPHPCFLERKVRRRRADQPAGAAGQSPPG